MPPKKALRALKQLKCVPPFLSDVFELRLIVRTKASEAEQALWVARQ
jgi:hypothetical protein